MFTMQVYVRDVCELLKNKWLSLNVSMDLQVACILSSTYNMIRCVGIHVQDFRFMWEWGKSKSFDVSTGPIQIRPSHPPHLVNLALGREHLPCTPIFKYIKGAGFTECTLLVILQQIQGYLQQLGPLTTVIGNYSRITQNFKEPPLKQGHLPLNQDTMHSPTYNINKSTLEIWTPLLIRTH